MPKCDIKKMKNLSNEPQPQMAPCTNEANGPPISVTLSSIGKHPGGRKPATVPMRVRVCREHRLAAQADHSLLVFVNGYAAERPESPEKG